MMFSYTRGEAPFRGSGKEERGVGTIAEPRTHKVADLSRYLYHCTTIPKRPGGQVYLRAELRRIPLPRTRVNRPSSGAPDFTRWHHACGGMVGSAGSKGIGMEEDEMRLLYIVTKGMEDPTLASVPLHIAANGSLDTGQEVSVVLAGDATDLVIEDNLQRLEGVGVPPARELLGKLKEHEVPVYV